MIRASLDVAACSQRYPQHSFSLRLELITEVDLCVQYTTDLAALGNLQNKQRDAAALEAEIKQHTEVRVL